MSLISIPYTFSAGAVIVAAQHNSNFSTIASDYNGNIDNTNIAPTAAILASKLNLTSPNGIGTTSPAAGKFTTLEATTSFKLGTTNQGDIIYDNGTSFVRLTPGTTGQTLTTNGAGANPSWGGSLHGTQIFTSSGSFVAPVGITTAYVSGSGGGAGGGGVHSGGSGGGGGGGAWIMNYPYTVIPGNTYTVTINSGGVGGAGGSGATGTSGGSVVFDALTLPGGAGGVGSSSAGAQNGGAGGAGAGASYNASASVSTVGVTGVGYVLAGGNGGKGSTTVQGGGGAGSPFGTGGTGGLDPTVGGNATGYGAGGGGGCASGASDRSGGNGTNGIIILIY